MEHIETYRFQRVTDGVTWQLYAKRHILPKRLLIWGLCSMLPILSISGVDRHDCIYQGFSVLCERWIELVFFRTLSIHLNIDLPRCIFPSASSLLLPLQHSCSRFSLGPHTTKGVISGCHMWCLSWPLHRSWTLHSWFCFSVFSLNPS